MRVFHPPRRLDAKKNSHSPVCDSIFLGLSGQKSDDMSSRPTKILKISAFRDFFVTEPKCQKGAKNRVKTRFLRRISILCSSYVPLTQSGYFLQNSMAGVNSCRDSRLGIYKCYCPSNCSVICLKKFADHRSREALSRMKLRTSSLAEA